MKHTITVTDSDMALLLSALRVRIAVEGESIKLGRVYGWNSDSNKRAIAAYAKLYSRVRRAFYRCAK